MNFVKKWIFASLLLAAIVCAEINAKRLITEDEDSVIIEAAELSDLSNDVTNRKTRELSEAAGEVSCTTAKGDAGRCETFKDCHPFFKIPDLSALEGWVLGIYDTCSIKQNNGTVTFGICCTEPKYTTPNSLDESTNAPIVEEPYSDSEKNEIVRRPGIFGNWPPPIPTHPPYTFPPLPTHPTSPETVYPLIITQIPGALITNNPGISKPVPKPPARPITTTKRPGTTWPTKRPVSTTVTESSATKPISSPGSSTTSIIGSTSCGAKNGDQFIDDLDTGKIVGGMTAQIGEWPWVVAIFNAGRHLCGGSLIDDRHILTAAHCVANMNSWDVARVTVRLGDYNIRTPNEVQHVERRVKRVVRHRGFNSRTLYNDIALLTLNQPVEFTQNIRPICLPTGSKHYIDQKGTVIGWGSLKEGGISPGVLQQVSIPIWSNSLCKQKYGAAAPGGIVDSFICAGQPAKDSCSGDSGGPLMVNDGRWTQVGIVSWGIGCGSAKYPGVYTRVTHFLPWIHKNLK